MSQTSFAVLVALWLSVSNLDYAETRKVSKDVSTDCTNCTLCQYPCQPQVPPPAPPVPEHPLYGTPPPPLPGYLSPPSQANCPPVPVQCGQQPPPYAYGYQPPPYPYGYQPQDNYSISLLTQIVVGANLLGLSEGLVLAEKAGLDARNFVDSVRTGATG
ncbi:unnamed protein product [Dovyalis caffra]|uniref:Uncharacterized protein n=1 Tax=Dovyalis caffra TaxID=77055 RepID=A0AAV1QUN8_9ROSI|nr:unnamed protein product [Dovyalis caffra]